MSQIVYAAEYLAGTAQRSSAPNTPLTRYLPVVGRALMATIFLMSGLSKVTAPDATIGYIQVAGLPMPQVALAAAVLIEIVGGLLPLAGYRTRLIALLLAGFAVATAYDFHANFADQNQTIHFLKNLAMAGGLLQVAAFGAGGYSLDAHQTRR